MSPVRTRVKEPDEVCAQAVDLARAAAQEVAGVAGVGEHAGAHAEAERVVTHLFASLDPAYRGWRWAVTVARAARAKNVTVSEIVLLPGRDSILAPDWVPWRERLRPGDLGVGDIMPAPPDDERLAPAVALEGEDGLAAWDESGFAGAGEVILPSAPGEWAVGGDAGEAVPGEAVAGGSPPSVDVASGAVVPGATVPGATVPGATAPGEGASGAAVPGVTAPAEAVPAEAVPAEGPSGAAVPGVAVPGEAASGAAVPGVTVPAEAVAETASGGPASPAEGASGAAVPGEAAPGGPASGAAIPGETGPGAAVPGAGVPGETAPGGPASAEVPREEGPATAAATAGSQASTGVAAPGARAANGRAAGSSVFGDSAARGRSAAEGAVGRRDRRRDARLIPPQARVLSAIGRDDAALRWYTGEHGPASPLAHAAPGMCGGCGFFVRLGGPLGHVFGVCANEYAPDDGRVVSVDHGCGAHSEGLPSQGAGASAPPVIDELGYDLVDRPGVSVEETDFEPLDG